MTGELLKAIDANKAAEDEVAEKRRILEQRGWLEDDVERRVMSNAISLAECAEDIEKGGYSDLLSNIIVRLHEEIAIYERSQK